MMLNYPFPANINKKAMAKSSRVRKNIKSATAPFPDLPLEKLPKQVDLSKYLYYVRKQWGGCWGYSMLAVWDIMNEIACPYSPNLSFRLWRTLHSRLGLSKKAGGVFSPDGRFHKIKGGGLEWGKHPFFQTFGCTTEGTEPTLHGHPSLWQDTGWSREGINEADNYRLEAEPRKIQVDSSEFIRWLSDFHPIRVSGGVHVVAVVGFDRIAETFKFVNSAGDKWNGDGYGTFTFNQLDNHEHLWFLGGPIGDAQILKKWRKVAAPRPVPAARIAFAHSDRANVQLWLSVEDSPHPRSKIWSHGWDDNSRNLSLTVRLPDEFIWPPSQRNRLILDLFDTGEFSKGGGTLKEFTAAFGGHTVSCSALSKMAVSFGTREHLRFTIP